MSEGFFYLSTPFTLYAEGHEVAAHEAARIAGVLLSRGIIVYSPIAHTYAIAKASGLPMTGHAFWMKADYPFVDKARGLIVAEMEGWENSEGIRDEIRLFRAAKKPIFYLYPSDL